MKRRVRAWSRCALSSPFLIRASSSTCTSSPALAHVPPSIYAFGASLMLFGGWTLASQVPGSPWNCADHWTPCSRTPRPPCTLPRRRLQQLALFGPGVPRCAWCAGELEPPALQLELLDVGSAEHRGPLYCSRRCRELDEGHPPRFCRECGAELKGRDPLAFYCDRWCREHAYRARVEAKALPIEDHAEQLRRLAAEQEARAERDRADVAGVDDEQLEAAADVADVAQVETTSRKRKRRAA